jgi:nitrate reductase delta subunit
VGPAVLHGRGEVCDALAVLLAYPDDGYEARAAAAGEVLARHAPTAHAVAAPFLRHVAVTPRAELEERYTRTFDWSPTCSLEVGWHLFGERYERGAFLADMRASLRAAGVEEGTELPDHLGSCLRWLGRAEPDAAATLARDAVAPAVARMRKGLGDGDAPWGGVLQAVESVVGELVASLADAGGR